MIFPRARGTYSGRAGSAPQTPTMMPKEQAFSKLCGHIVMTDVLLLVVFQGRYQGRAVSRVSMSFNLKGPAAWRLLFQVQPDPKGFDLKKIKPRSPC